MQTFQEDLKTAQKTEKYVLSLLIKEFPTLKQVKGKSKDYDLVDDNGYGFEVKFDKMSKETKQLGFEFKCYGKPSGIKATKAMEWVHIYYLYDKPVYSRVKVQDLKNFLRVNRDYLAVVSGGDNNASKMVLVSVYDFTDAFPFFYIS
jgi:hypothetical protein